MSTDVKVGARHENLSSGRVSALDTKTRNRATSTLNVSARMDAPSSQARSFGVFGPSFLAASTVAS